MEAKEHSRLQNILKEESNKPKKKMKLLEKATEYLRQFESSRTWLNNIKSERTKKKYCKNFFKYCIGVKLTPDELLKLKLKMIELVLMTESERQKIRQTFDERKAEKTLENFLAEAKFKDLLGIKNCVVSFYKANRKELVNVAPTVVQEQPQPEELIKKKPKIDEVIKMAESTPNPRDEFLIWFIQSTGFRRETVTLLNFADLMEIQHINDETFMFNILDEEQSGELDDLAPIMLHVGSKRLKGKGKGKYKGVEQVTFLHFLAYQKLKKYMQFIRQNFKLEITKDTPLFLTLRKPHKRIAHGTVYDILADASVNAFGNGKSYSPHNLRLYCQTALENARLNPNHIAKIVGHIIKGVDKSYSAPEKLDLHKHYKTAIPHFIPKDQPQPQVHLMTQIQRLTNLVNEQRETIKGIPKILNMEKKIEDLYKLMANSETKLQQTDKAITKKEKELNQ